MDAEAFELVPPGGPRVRGVVHRPATPDGQALLLTHGAGSNADAPLLTALARAFATQALTVLRCDLPFRQARTTGPPRPGDATLDRAGLRQAVGALRRLVAGRVFLGGHSYGGRQASLLAAEAPGLADGLLLLSYPLHPPRQPRDLRTTHFGALQTPALFVHGTRDAFGTIEEMRTALRLIPAPTALVEIEGAGHDLSAPGHRDPSLPGVSELIVQAFGAFVRTGLTGRPGLT